MWFDACGHSGGLFAKTKCTDFAPSILSAFMNDTSSSMSSFASKKIYSAPFFHFCKRSEGPTYWSAFFLNQNGNHFLVTLKRSIKWYEYYADTLGVFPLITNEPEFQAAMILELARESDDQVTTYGELWKSFRPDSPWLGNATQRIVCQSLAQVIAYCVRHKLPIVTTLVVNGGKRKLAAAAIQNIYQECKKLGVVTGSYPETFVEEQIAKSKALALHDLPDDSNWTTGSKSRLLEGD